LFNLGMGYRKIDEVDDKIKVGINPVQTNIVPLVLRKQLPKFSAEFRKDIIRRYNPTHTYPKNKKKINICIHMRRGDTVYPSGRPKFRWRMATDDFLIEVLRRINKFIKKPVSINIHSDSVIDMEKFETYDLEINTKFDDTGPRGGRSPEQAMQDMIACDILFRTGISAFSGVCAFYNTNLVISALPVGCEGMYVMDNVYGLGECNERLWEFNRT